MSTRPLTTNYLQDNALFASYWNKLGLICAVAIFILVPAISNDYWLSIANKALITIVGAVALMLLTGFTGQISLGHAAFIAIGAYTAAILANFWGFPFWFIFPFAGLTAGLVGFIVGPFALRLKGLYLAIVTLALVYIVNYILILTGSYSALSVPMHWFFTFSKDPLGSFAQDFELGPILVTFEMKLYFLFCLLALFTLLFAKNLQRSKLGRAMMAVRDHDLAAAVMGINISRVKIQAFTISSFIAGIAGAMFAFKQQTIAIDATTHAPFNLHFSIQYIAIIIIGGLGTVSGAIYGSLVFILLSPVAELIGASIPLVNQLTNEQQSTLLFSIIVGAFLIYEPLGLFGIWLKIKRFFMTWPFRY